MAASRQARIVAVLGGILAILGAAAAITLALTVFPGWLRERHQKANRCTFDRYYFYPLWQTCKVSEGESSRHPCMRVEVFLQGNRSLLYRSMDEKRKMPECSLIVCKSDPDQNVESVSQWAYELRNKESFPCSIDPRYPAHGVIMGDPVAVHWTILCVAGPAFVGLLGMIMLLVSCARAMASRLPTPRVQQDLKMTKRERKPMKQKKQKRSKQPRDEDLFDN